MVTPNQQHVFHRNTDGTIQHLFWDASANKIFTDNWTQKAGAPQAVGDPATMFASDQQHIFYRTADGSIQHLFWDSSSPNQIFADNWTHRANAPAAAGNPATMVTANQQHIFYRTTDGSIQHLLWDSSSPNQIFADNWTHRANAPTAVGNPATMVTPNQQHIFYRAANGTIQHLFWDSSSPNQIFSDNWTQRSGSPVTTNDPVTMVTPNQQHVFYRRNDATVQHLFWDVVSPNQIFSDDWTTKAGASAAAGNPAAMATG
jgi:hypothetical protein